MEATTSTTSTDNNSSIGTTASINWKSQRTVSSGTKDYMIGIQKQNIKTNLD
jgi:hypothetical protein